MTHASKKVEQERIEVILEPEDQVLLLAFFEKIGFWGNEAKEDVFAHELYRLLKAAAKAGEEVS